MHGTVVVALGGNAILQPGQTGTLAEQTANIRSASREIGALIAGGYRVVLTHGNGPQVGNILLQNEAARDWVPAMPLDVLGAESQGEIGYLFQRELQRDLQRRGIGSPVVSLLTQVVVDPADPAFARPTKPVGPFYPEGEARARMASTGAAYAEDAGRGWRRIVPSPYPRRIVELAAIRRLIEAGTVVICCGGGGIPVIETADGLQGVEAVIDKDLAAQRLATDMGADQLLILTDVPQVYLDYGKPTQRALSLLLAAEAQRYLDEGQFPAGSMRSKVEGAIQFVAAGDRRAIITSLSAAVTAVEGRAGTQIVSSATAAPPPQGWLAAGLEAAEPG